MKKISFPGLITQLEVVQRQFDDSSIAMTLSLLKQLSQLEYGTTKAVIRYADALLFSIAYPANEGIYRLAEKEIKRLCAYVEHCTHQEEDGSFYNSGISGSEICAEFSLTHNGWLLRKFKDQVEFYAEEHNEEYLMNMLNHLLHPIEQEMMNPGKSDWSYWSHHLTGSKGDQHHLLRHIVEATEEIPVNRTMKEFIFAEYKTYTTWKSRKNAPTMFAGRAVKAPVYFHRDGILKRMTLMDALSQGMPKKIELSNPDKQKLIDLGKGTLCGLLRETDPITYANLKETELFDMGRGISIALYYMTPDMKMSLQSYAGYMLFKNGVPCAYGGGWLLNQESGFGVNIFPPFRGGESANVVCQLLRLYALHFNANTFTVDPYQIGLDNPDGIKSGSFWFYYRLGFRPEQKKLFELAEREFKKISTKKGYKTSEKVLIELAHSSMRWVHPERKDKNFIVPDNVGLQIEKFVTDKHHGDRKKAMKSAHEKVGKILKEKTPSISKKGNIELLLDCSGALENVSASELESFLHCYELKPKSEHAYILGAQKFQRVFSAIADISRK